MQYVSGAEVQLYGTVKIGAGSIIEDNVVIGHPKYTQVTEALKNLDRCVGLLELYRVAAEKSSVSIGSGSIIRSGTVIYADVIIGKQFDCGHNVIIREGVHIGDQTYVKNNTEIMVGVAVGDRCRISGVVADNCKIGSEVSTFGVLTHTYSSYVSTRSAKASEDATCVEAPVVEDRAVVSRGAVIIGSCTIGRGAVVAANAVVRKDVPSNHLLLPDGRLLDRGRR